ncbi:MAG: YkgJ family cysteine cluster protein [Thiotrichales bacterium]|nr:YkgJ family cysteine cluster protein [Thiotrichales bacterium]
MTEFPCNSCGACCRNVHLAKETQHLDRGDGCCWHYDDNTRQCSIYAERPSICRVDEQYAINYRNIMTWKTFVELNLLSCETLRAKDIAN